MKNRFVTLAIAAAMVGGALPTIAAVAVPEVASAAAPTTEDLQFFDEWSFEVRVKWTPINDLSDSSVLIDIHNDSFFKSELSTSGTFDAATHYSATGLLPCGGDVIGTPHTEIGQGSGISHIHLTGGGGTWPSPGNFGLPDFSTGIGLVAEERIPYHIIPGGCGNGTGGFDATMQPQPVPLYLPCSKDALASMPEGTYLQDSYVGEAFNFQVSVGYLAVKGPLANAQFLNTDCHVDDCADTQTTFAEVSAYSSGFLGFEELHGDVTFPWCVTPAGNVLLTGDVQPRVSVNHQSVLQTTLGAIGISLKLKENPNFILPVPHTAPADLTVIYTFEACLSVSNFVASAAIGGIGLGARVVWSKLPLAARKALLKNWQKMMVRASERIDFDGPDSIGLIIMQAVTKEFYEDSAAVILQDGIDGLGGMGEVCVDTWEVALDVTLTSTGNALVLARNLSGNDWFKEARVITSG